MRRFPCVEAEREFQGKSGIVAHVGRPPPNGTRSICPAAAVMLAFQVQRNSSDPRTLALIPELEQQNEP